MISYKHLAFHVTHTPYLEMRVLLFVPGIVAEGCSMACKYSSYLISVCVQIRKQWSMSVVGGGGGGGGGGEGLPLRQMVRS